MIDVFFIAPELIPLQRITRVLYFPLSVSVTLTPDRPPGSAAVKQLQGAEGRN